MFKSKSTLFYFRHFSPNTEYFTLKTLYHLSFNWFFQITSIKFTQALALINSVGFDLCEMPKIYLF